MTQLAKITFWEGNRQDWSCGKSASKNQSLGQCSEVPRKCQPRVDLLLKVLAKRCAHCNGLRLGGLKGFCF